MAGQILTCGPFDVDPGTHVVRRNGEPLGVGLRAALILEALLSRPGDVLTKGELMDAAWAGAAVEESNLSVQVAALRKALGEAPGGSEWIVTIPRIGYRFVSAETMQQRPSAPEAGQQSIAVLPFENLSADPEQAYFADGLAEDILTALSKLSGLIVIGRFSSFAYRGADARKAAEELDVRYVLTGSVRRAGSRVRMNVQLNDTETSKTAWAESFDRELDDVFAIQDEITRRVVETLQVTLAPGERAAMSEYESKDLEALDLSRRGRAILFGPFQTRDTFVSGTTLLDRAVERDPGFAGFHTSLTIAQVTNHVNRWTSDHANSLAAARRHADRAIALDPTFAMGYAVSTVVAMCEHDGERMRIDSDRALALSPNISLVQTARGDYVSHSGAPHDAIPHFERAVRLDPVMTHHSIHQLACAYFHAQSYETAAALFRSRIAIFPRTDMSRGYLASALGHLGHHDEARTVWAELMAINPDYTFARHVGLYWFKDPEQPGRMLEGARKAGLPA